MAASIQPELACRSLAENTFMDNGWGWTASIDEIGGYRDTWPPGRLLIANGKFSYIITWSLLCSFYSSLSKPGLLCVPTCEQYLARFIGVTETATTAQRYNAPRQTIFQKFPTQTPSYATKKRTYCYRSITMPFCPSWTSSASSRRMPPRTPRWRSARPYASAWPT